jgi:hypothetical protein
VTDSQALVRAPRRTASYLSNARMAAPAQDDHSAYAQLVGDDV